ncbi:MAG: hypothetical protein PHU85_14635 [Phycisphaerae bacterium]|nr:hypothetical protein [Phycisphaerae bacterium]
MRFMLTLAAIALLAPAAFALDVPINLTETAGVARSADPVSVGVPIPRDLLADASKLCVLDPAGKKVPAQFEVLMSWFPTAKYPDSKKSVRWVLVDFQADVPANGKATYRLADTGPGPEHPAPVKLAPDNRVDGGETISTGLLGLSLSGKAFQLLGGVSFDKQSVIDARPADGLTLEGMDKKRYDAVKDLIDPPNAADIAYRGEDSYLKLNPHNPPKKFRFIVEKAGPLRTVVMVEGVMKAMSKDGGEYEYVTCGPKGEVGPKVKLPCRDESLAFRARIVAYAGKPYVRVFFTFINPKGLSHTSTDQEKYRANNYIEGGSQVPGNFQLESLELGTTLKLSGPAKYRFGGDTVIAGDLKADAADTATLYQDSSAGWIWQAAEKKLLDPVLKKNAEWMAENTKVDRPYFEFDPLQYAVLHNQDGYSFMGYRTLDAAGKETGAGNRSAGWVDVTDGKVGMTTAVRYFWQMCPKSLRVGGDGRVAVGILPKEWGRGHFMDGKIRRTHELMYRFHGAEDAAVAEQSAKAFNEPLVAYCDFDWYRDSGACGLFTKPDEKNWPLYEAQMKTAVHLDVNPKLNPARDSSFAIEREKDDAFGWEHFGDTAKRGFRGHSQFQEFDCSRCLLMHYFRTGDPQYFREAEICARFLANIPCFGGGYGHQHPESSHNWIQGLIDYWCMTGMPEAKEGIDAMEGFYRNCQSESAGNWHFNGRNAAYALNGLRQFYELTGDDTWAKAANTCIRSVRQRTRPVSGFFGGNPADFMQHVLGDAAGRYALLTGDADAIDLLLGMACYFKPFGGQGKGPGTYDLYAYATMLTGDRTYLDAAIKNAKDADSCGPEGPMYRTGTASSKTWSEDLGGRMQVFFHAMKEWKPADAAPPAAVTDLAAQPGDAGSVKLTWTNTSDGKDERPAAVLVKHAPGEIVESVPWARNKMDATVEAEWKDKVNYWYADNVTARGVIPAKYGEKQNTVVTGLPSGKTLWFVVRLVDKAGNRSKLSNCVKAIVP